MKKIKGVLKFWIANLAILGMVILGTVYSIQWAANLTMFTGWAVLILNTLLARGIGSTEYDDKIVQMYNATYVDNPTPFYLRIIIGFSSVGVLAASGWFFTAIIYFLENCFYMYWMNKLEERYNKIEGENE